MSDSIFQTYLNRLTDLSSKNKSLYLPKLDGVGKIELREFDFLNNEPAFEILRKIIQEKKRIQLIPEVDPRMGETNQLAKSLSRLAFRDQLTQEETGDQSMFLAWPFVEGKLINGQILRAPLLLLPVQLKREKDFWWLIVTDSWQWNPAFLLAYRHAYQKTIDEEKLQEELGNLSEDSTEFRTQLNQTLSENFQIQLSSSLFEDQFTRFPSSQISLDQDRFQDGNISLKTYAVLGQFAQSGNFLFREYDQLKSSHDSDSLEDLFERYFAKGEIQPIPREERLFPIFPLDASQENALLKVREGKSLVVEGPPGTGKSQLIANLVSDFIARGKKVLVVSQKRAALDVVFERMEKAGFGDFLALVHDYRADHRILFEKIRKQIQIIEDYQEQNRGIDSIQLEREISRLSGTITRLSEKFENLRKELFNPQPAGIPIKAMYRNAALEIPALKEASLLLKLNFEQSLDFEKEFKIFHGYSQKFGDTFWENRVSFAEAEPGDFGRIHHCLSEIEQVRKTFPKGFGQSQWIDFLSSVLHSSNVSERFLPLLECFYQLPKPEISFRIPFLPQEIKKLNQIQKWISKAGIELSGLSLIRYSEPEQLESLNYELEVLLPKSKSFFGKLIAGWSKGKFPLSFQILGENGLKLGFESLSLIGKEAKIRLRLYREYSELPQIQTYPMKEFFPEKPGEHSKEITDILHWEKRWTDFAEIQNLCPWANLDYESFRSRLTSLSNWTLEFAKSVQGWRLWLTPAQILTVLNGEFVQHSTDNELILDQTFSELVAFDRFLKNWEQEKRELAKALQSQFPDLQLEAKILAFRNGWYLAWIGELERRNPSLAEAGSLKLAHEMDELKSAILEKRKISRHIALLRLREQVSTPLEFNRLGNRLTYRELLHQVSKKRQRWSVRKLAGELGSEVFRLLPCWLASPETVSALFPLMQNFDLVIFDEASQCPVERGLPAMLRGKQVVVAGDSKQLRPSDFYQVKWESEEEGMEYEAESLLELAGHFFEKIQLRGHYRSADPALIHFSNSHFYDNKLETLPDYLTVKAGKTPFCWQKVEGIWENQMNKTEADAVVQKVKTILENHPSDSIGIVTGNYFQMELIREKLWKSGNQSDKIKVRNIENVQGDEFDQVILSLGYAANREGKLITNFGLLGKSGAENRLNVAITRARKMLHVISSIEPEDFRPGQLSNPGLALLREFLIWVKTQSLTRAVPAPEVAVAGFEIDWSLKNQLLEEDNRFSRQIPSAVMDLVWTDRDVEQTAILTDDQRFFNTPTAKAAIAYHPILLEAKGWKWEWKWSRLWKAEV
jgi:hypothetical protein